MWKRQAVKQPPQALPSSHPNPFPQEDSEFSRLSGLWGALGGSWFTSTSSLHPTSTVLPTIVPPTLSVLRHKSWKLLQLLRSALLLRVSFGWSRASQAWSAHTRTTRAVVPGAAGALSCSGPSCSDLEECLGSFDSRDEESSMC